jgi:hypothetical protein
MTTLETTTFVEVGHWQVRKDGEGASGDAFLSQKNEADGRVISFFPTDWAPGSRLACSRP